MRIVTLAPNVDEILCSYGVADRIVGVSRFTLYPAQLDDRPRIGGLFDPDLEGILALRPDCLVLRGHNEQIEDLCATHHIRLVHDPTEDLAGLIETMRALGALVGTPGAAEEHIHRLRDAIDKLRAEGDRRHAGRRRPRVLLTTARNPVALRDILTSSKGTIHDELITLAGGVNVFGELDIKYPQLALEDIVARSPDVIIELMPEVHVTDDLKRDILEQWRQLGPMPAARDGRIYVLGDEPAYAAALIPSPRILDLGWAMLERIHGSAPASDGPRP